MMRNKLPQALPCLQITGLAAQVAEKYGLRPVPYSALAPRVRHALSRCPCRRAAPTGKCGWTGITLRGNWAAGRCAMATLPGGTSLRN